MQQTKTYDLKLIETGDPFSPEALNANAETLEAELARVDAALLAEQSARETAAAAETARVDAALGAKAAQTDLTRANGEITRLDGEITRIDAALLRLATGSYDGDGTKNRKIEVGFTPKVVYVGFSEQGRINSSSSESQGGVALESLPVRYTSTGESIVEIVEGGFLVSYVSNNTANRDGYTFRWFAIG